ncbi:MAG: MFS transporter [Puniceicoccales bacterium]
MSVHRIKTEDKIPFAQKIAFAAGVNTEYAANGLLKSMLLMPFFNIGMGMSPATIGVVLMFYKVWDAAIDPMIGNLSDNLRTRWGRRRPFMLVGALGTAVVYPFFWGMPMGMGTVPQAVWLIVVGLLFYACYTLWSIPYYGLQLELTPSYDERTRLAAWMAVFGKLFWLCAGWFFAFVMLIGSVATNAPAKEADTLHFLREFLLPFQESLARLSGAVGAEGEMPPIVAGMRISCWIIVGAILLFGLLPVFFVKERYYESRASRQAREPFWQSIKDTFHCKPLWYLVGASSLLTVGSSSVISLGQYMNFYYVNGGDLEKAAFIGGVRMSVTVAVGLMILPVLTKLGEIFDKRKVVIGLLACTLFGHLLNYFCLTPEYPYLQVVPAIFESCAMGALWMFFPSMRADVADFDEIKTERRREGSINACFSFFIKLATTASLGLSGIVLVSTGFDSGLSVQPDSVLRLMFDVYLWLPVVIWAGAIILIWSYPLSRDLCAKIRDDLEERRGRL